LKSLPIKPELLAFVMGFIAGMRLGQPEAATKVAFHHD
jgi:hypothetical protein